jgi:hypothetical protein
LVAEVVEGGKVGEERVRETEGREEREMRCGRTMKPEAEAGVEVRGWEEEEATLSWDWVRSGTAVGEGMAVISPSGDAAASDEDVMREEDAAEDEDATEDDVPAKEKEKD